MSRPGDRRIEIAAAWDCFFEPGGDDWTNLHMIRMQSTLKPKPYIQHQSVNEDELSDDDCRPLKVDCLPAVVAEILDY